MMPRFDDSMTDEQIAQRKLFIKTEKLLGLAMDAWPGFLSLKDVTHEPWWVVHMNEPMIKYVEMRCADFYGKPLENILNIKPEHAEALRQEELKVINGPFEKEWIFKGPSINGDIYRRRRFKFEDGDKLYTCVSMEKVDDEGC